MSVVKKRKVILRNLEKISLNKWYSGSHWSFRKKSKDKYLKAILSQFKGVLSKDRQYEVDYTFFFKSRPLDASNTVAMLKLIEDIIFEDDKWDIILSVSMKSRKDKNDERVEIVISEVINE